MRFWKKRNPAKTPPAEDEAATEREREKTRQDIAAGRLVLMTGGAVIGPGQEGIYPDGRRVSYDQIARDEHPMTLSFHKVQFDAQEVLDMAAEAETLLDFQNTFCDLAEERSRLNTRLGDECPTCGDTYHDLPRHLQLNYKGCADATCCRYHREDGRKDNPCMDRHPIPNS